MALSLTAEQRNLLKIFNIEEQYIVPAYQRPYSWEYDQCFQLYKDLTDAYYDKNDYFLGSIIIAKSNKDTLEIIDGQQRLITLLLLLKVLYIFQPELRILEKVLELEDWDGINSKPRIQSEIFESNDSSKLVEVLCYDKETLKRRYYDCLDKNGKILERKCNNKFEKNLIYFFHWITYLNDQKENIKEFTSYLLKNAFLLPIELTGDTQEEASEKALVVFETINNRGMNLEDADIFKAKLYKKARNIKEEDLFIESWREIKKRCVGLKLDIDDVFRYYSHIIRGEEKITISEINLREFFTAESYSPFEKKKYKEIVDDLLHVIEILEFIDFNNSSSKEITKWLQIIEVYTNQYPKFAVVAYLYVYGVDGDDESFINFMKSLIRHIYYEGATTKIKFEIYSIIKQICSHQEIDKYYNKVDIFYFDDLGRLKYGFALLGFYLNNNETLNYYKIDKLINLKDRNYLLNKWTGVSIKEVEEIILSLGNLVVLDIPIKNISFDRKLSYYNESDIGEVRELVNSDISNQSLYCRDRKIKESLVDFFEK